ncbi:MAG TPA: ABC transporter ATP-binding protein [Limnochordia bacterium]
MKEGWSLTVEELRAGYGGIEVVRGVNLHISAGEIVTIIGPNGAGKSTLLKAIFGLAELYGGRIRIGDDDLTGLPPERLVRQGLSFVPQDRNVFARLTVDENLEMGAYTLPERGQARRDRLERVYTLFPDLAQRRHQRAGLLSGGQQQMLAIGRALMLTPRLLLLDEPTASLSPLVARMIFEKIREINQDGVAILMVEQNARAALELSHRGYVLAMGANRAEGPAAELLADSTVGELFLGG